MVLAASPDGGKPDAGRLRPGRPAGHPRAMTASVTGRSVTHDRLSLPPRRRRVRRRSRRRSSSGRGTPGSSARCASSRRETSRVGAAAGASRRAVAGGARWQSACTRTRRARFAGRRRRVPPMSCARRRGRRRDVRGRRDRSRLSLRFLAARRCSRRCSRRRSRWRASSSCRSIIHTREADDDTFAILREAGGAGGPRRVPLLHRGLGDGARGAGSGVLHLASPGS